MTNGESATHQETLAHTLLTSHVEVPDLALAVGLWNRLTSPTKHRPIGVVEANLPTQRAANQFDEGVNDSLCPR
jgi:hypothetical protein